MEKPSMTPKPGDRLVRFVGDRVRFRIEAAEGKALPAGWRALLRTNLGRASLVREEIIQSNFKKLPLAGASWRDVPMMLRNGGWELDLPVTEVGYFKSKPYLLDPKGVQIWPDGADVGVSVHPDAARSANTIYCAFTRMFGPSKTAKTTIDEKRDEQLRVLDQQGYAVIPPSGKLRDLIKELPHIVDTLGCRILHLLPVNPTPTTYARFGRFGSPYAAEDLTAIDAALVEFDKKTTGVEQFCELTSAAHKKGARVFLDIVINHTGWGSTLQENHPEWFMRKPDGHFESPGAWGVQWEDLVELDQRWPELWRTLAEMLLVWCQRGVDGFRCDAGYKIPMPAWQYITARVHQEFPDTVFLLEGLGGGWDDTVNLLTNGGMQWAYSELFQNTSPVQVSGYLDHSLKQSQQVGLLVNYSETHDNNRLAATSRAWSLLRNRLCALTSVSGGFGFTCGVEWLAAEKVNVHSSRGLSWNNADNIVPELAALNRFISEHPCFQDGAVLQRLSEPDSPVYALRRDSAEGKDTIYILANTDLEKEREIVFDAAAKTGRIAHELLGQTLPAITFKGDKASVKLPPAACYCLAAEKAVKGLSGEAYRVARAQAAWGLKAVNALIPLEQIGQADWRKLAELVNRDPSAFLAAVTHLDAKEAHTDLLTALERAITRDGYPPVVRWTLADRTRILSVPCKHWLLVQDATPFRVTLKREGEEHETRLEAIRAGNGFMAVFNPVAASGAGTLKLERYADENTTVVAQILFLAETPVLQLDVMSTLDAANGSLNSPLVLLTNGIGGMARLGVDFGRVKSKYDCLLGANLHASLPVDRHIFAKRARVWVNADGFITPLNAQNLVEFEPGPPARWRFVVNAGDGRSVEIELLADMLETRNATVLSFQRPAQAPSMGRDLPANADVRLTVRVDIEDRNFHWETKRNSGAEFHFSSHVHPLSYVTGFEFRPTSDRWLRVFSSVGQYHHESEWVQDIPHPVEQSRGQTGSGDTYSPGWFDLPLPKNGNVQLTVCAETELPAPKLIRDFAGDRAGRNQRLLSRSGLPESDAFGRQLALAVKAFLVRRDKGKTVIAGYPWFLDWGRDSLIAARGLLAAGLIVEVEQLLATFGRFVENGTLPNTIHGSDASNRDTSDAPLWYGVVCEEFAELAGNDIYREPVDEQGKTIADVLREIASGCAKGTPNGIRMDEASGLLWSPSHFTWMDTNFPAGTPREGYPVEIQVLWIRLLKQLERLGATAVGESWGKLARRAEESFHRYFWLEDAGYYADVLLCKAGQPARTAAPDNALRSNCLFAVSLGLAIGERARRCVDAAARHLVIPGALRSIAPLPVSPPLAIYTSEGRLLNNPPLPYWPRYEGDEDTRRKPAYHNGTGWTWTFPTFCEAVVKAWGRSPGALAAARSYLGSASHLLSVGCVGHLPEVVDGDAPHQQRGCDAQAWSVTEALRVWKWLNE